MERKLGIEKNGRVDLNSKSYSRYPLVPVSESHKQLIASKIKSGDYTHAMHCKDRQCPDLGKHRPL